MTVLVVHREADNVYEYGISRTQNTRVFHSDGQFK